MTKKNIINGKSISLSIGLLGIAIAIAIAIIISLGIGIEIFRAHVETGNELPAVALQQGDNKTVLVDLKDRQLVAAELKPVAGALSLKSLEMDLLGNDLDGNEKQLSPQSLEALKVLSLKALNQNQSSLDLAALPSLVNRQLSLQELT